MSNDNDSLKAKNKKIVVTVGVVVVAMVALSFAFVPLYKLLCRVTGLDGTPKIVSVGPKEVLERTVTVKFDANVAAGLPWHFAPRQRQVTVKLGETLKFDYEARNNGTRDVTGTALYTITPEKAAKYFHKMQCFCFDEQTLKPGESAQFPVAFYVSPDMDKDPNVRDVNTITLSYTFFEAGTPALDKAVEDFYNQDPETPGAEAKPHTHADGEDHSHSGTGKDDHGDNYTDHDTQTEKQ